MPAVSELRPTPWRRVASTATRLFHAYANWLVGIGWGRFILLSLLLLILASLLQQLPPFRWSWTEVVEESGGTSAAPTPPRPPSAPAHGRWWKGRQPADDPGVTISIDGQGVRIETKPTAGAASGAASTAASAAPAASGSPGRAVASGASSGAIAPPAAGAEVDRSSHTVADHAEDSITIRLPGASAAAVRAAAQAARDAAREAAEEARQEAAEALEDARQEARDARLEAAEAAREARQSRRTRIVHLGDSLTDLAFFWIVASAVLKAAYKGRVQAEVMAAEANETAESEQLKRQVVEARMAAMQAQVEPHFLFNTLASIDHLIETDPARASTMQKNLIALLRAAMPAMRDNHPAAQTLGREMAVIRPYLEILKVRMEDRLQAEIDVPAGLLSAEFPAMSIQGLVENAIKHGLEPKAEGGTLTVRAEVVDGRLAVTVADTGLGFGKAPTAGTGVGLANLRERLALLYGGRATLVIGENTPSGTVVTVSVPYVAQARAETRV